MEEKLKLSIKRDLIFTWVVFAILLVIQLCMCVYAISVFVNYESSEAREIFFSVTALVVFCVVDVLAIFKDIIPITKDYKSKQIEKMRGMIVTIKSVPRFSYEIAVKSLDDDREIVFSISEKNIDLYKVYDFWYAQHSKRVEYVRVTDEELTEASREKASKIILDTDNKTD